MEGTMFGRQDNEVITEQDLEVRLVSFYRVAARLDKIFVVDVYAANVLYVGQGTRPSVPLCPSALTL